MMLLLGAFAHMRLCSVDFTRLLLGIIVYLCLSAGP